jgi:hypothetical protein
MSYQDHLRTCSYCSKGSQRQLQKPTVRIKAASSYQRERKLSELASIIKGTKAATSVTITQSYLSDQVRKAKLRELGRMVKG